MRWLIIALLVSVGGLLLAAAGMVRHILLPTHKAESIERLKAMRLWCERPKHPT